MEMEIIDNTLKISNQLCFRLYAASRNMTRLYQPLLDKYNLTYPQYIILLVLFEQVSIDFKELSDVVDLKAGTLTPIVNRLVELGYVKKEKNPLDGRKLNVIITKNGKILETKIVDVPKNLLKALDMSKYEYTTLINQIDDLLEKLKKAQMKKEI